MSATSTRRILKISLGLKPYKKTIELSLSDDQKIKRKQFANWLRTYFRKENTLRILFSDKKFFDIDDVYNSENERVWAINHADGNKKWCHAEIKIRPEKVMVWLGAWCKGLTLLMNELLIIVATSKTYFL